MMGSMNPSASPCRRGAVAAQMLYLQLVQASGPTPTVAAQLFAMDK